uniref:Uncharacterized protein n=1 Tax=Anguilla anguilla TaxID=7936 RepID=A0A0E9PS61_ANGAN
MCTIFLGFFKMYFYLYISYLRNTICRGLDHEQQGQLCRTPQPQSAVLVT